MRDITMDYREADDQVFSIIRQYGEELAGTVKKTKFPKTYLAMLSFIAKAVSLKLGLFDLCESENIYAFNVLFRSFCEHYVKFMYIWCRFIIDQTDQVGLDYYQYCGATELIDYVNSLKAAEAIVGHEVVIRYDELVKQFTPEATGISINELKRRSNQFRYRSIIRFIAEKAPKIVSEECRFLLNIIPKYADLSAFVHGGPTTDRRAPEFISNKGIESCAKDASMIFVMSTTIPMFTAIAMSKEFPSFLEAVNKINIAIKDYLAGNE